MSIRIAVGTAAFLAALCGFLAYQAFVREAPRARGPLYHALLEAHIPEQRRQNLDAVFAQFIDADLSLARRETVLVENGFHCSLRPARVVGNSMLSCRRPVDGTRYCEGFLYFSYQTASGEIIETMGTSYSVDQRNRRFGRCVLPK